MNWRCENGHRWEWRGGRSGHPNDPDAGEVDLGVCPDCEGCGCENNVDEISLLTRAAQLIDTIKSEWSPDGAWSEWDQEVRDDITKRLRWLTTKRQEPYDTIRF